MTAKISKPNHNKCYHCEKCLIRKLLKFMCYHGFVYEERHNVLSWCNYFIDDLCIFVIKIGVDQTW
jgi:hypothetical protein